MIQFKSDKIPVKVKSEQTPQISERIPFLFLAGKPSCVKIPRLLSFASGCHQGLCECAYKGGASIQAAALVKVKSGKEEEEEVKLSSEAVVT